MKKSKKIWCGFHKRMEDVNNFHKDAQQHEGVHNCCKIISNKRVIDYQNRHREATNEKQSVYQKARNGSITESQKIQMITKINKRYGIKTRIK